MSHNFVAELCDRGVVRVDGSDAQKFLQGLLTNDLDSCPKGAAQFSGLLSPQGKILFDFIITADKDSFYLDVAKDCIPALMKRLTLYRLRADVTMQDVSDQLSVFAAWENHDMSDEDTVTLAEDPRLNELGSRILIRDGGAELANATEDDYHAHRISLGVPEGGKDYQFGDTYPHEALYDQMNGVSFTKGCFVGQEVVSRMEHRKATKKRVIQVRSSKALPPSGTDIRAGDIALGRLGSVSGRHGLALIRVDRLRDIANSGKPAEADGVALEFFKPNWATFDFA